MRKEFGETEARGSLEQLAKMESACIGKLGNLREAQVLGVMLTDELLGSCNDWRLGIVALDQDLVALHGQVFRKNLEQLDRSRVLV